MVKHTQTIRRQLFDHFVRLALKGLNIKLYYKYSWNSLKKIKKFWNTCLFDMMDLDIHICVQLLVYFKPTEAKKTKQKEE